MKTSPSAESGRRADRLLPGGAKAPSAVHFFGVSPRSGPFRWGVRHHVTGQLSGADAKFLPGLWLKILWTVYLPRTAETGCGYSSPGKSTAGNRPQGWRRKGWLRHQAQLPYTPSGVQERRFRRDRGGATGTVAASPVFQTSDRSGSPKPRQRVRRRLAGAPAAACRSRA
ncbi:hypothetical protein [Escherichia coli]|uniref:hypothetical protein n=1 Tax=Escherichia coli TaxID=562 RepID=UPI00193A559E|nr:hypothetical protein [Escherichia coli]